ncbi:hypothetical protein Bca52824_018457 [Brassica carinata]|uniref:RNase H type-1 domain-containing protein n=1 Tax=Brassica carinata TaxID=52824 RepID=A0A8X7VQ57_BRACI|nr:hypothetical protein Bca52824_018457 [Brassica carinata]
MEWLEANDPETQTQKLAQENQSREASWIMPPVERVKCNIGASWSSCNNRSGASWVVRDSRGKVLMHGRRSYVDVTDRQMAELLATCWAVECMHTMHMDNIIFESCFLLARTSLLDSCHSSEVGGVVSQIQNHLFSINTWSMEYVYPSRNKAAMRIALSVTAEGRYQSYIASNGPCWLASLIAQEAVA